MSNQLTNQPNNKRPNVGGLVNPEDDESFRKYRKAMEKLRKLKKSDTLSNQPNNERPNIGFASCFTAGPISHEEMEEESRKHREEMERSNLATNQPNIAIAPCFTVGPTSPEDQAIVQKVRQEMELELQKYRQEQFKRNNQK